MKKYRFDEIAFNSTEKKKASAFANAFFVVDYYEHLKPTV